MRFQSKHPDARAQETLVRGEQLAWTSKADALKRPFHEIGLGQFHRARVAEGIAGNLTENKVLAPSIPQDKGRTKLGPR